jgi:hypothetical protein
MAVTDNFFTPVVGGATYNVREAVMWQPYGTDKVVVRFASQPNVLVTFDAVAWAAALDAAEGSGF